MADQRRRLLRLSFRRHLAFCVLALALHLLLAGRQLPPSERHQPANSQYFQWGAARLVRAEPSWPQSTGQVWNDDTEEQSLLSIVLARIDAYLPVLNFNYTLWPGKRFDNGQLDAEVESFYEERWSANTSQDELQLLAVKAATRVAPMPLHISWGYESRDELRQGSLPVQDDARCAAHLGQLSGRMQRLTAVSSTPEQLEPGELAPLSVGGQRASPVDNLEARQLYRSQDLEFLRLLDTYGRVPSDVLRGNVRWYGSYDGCLDTKLKADPSQGGTKRIKFRYCMVALKSRGWPRTLPREQVDRSKWINYGVHTFDLNVQNFFIRLGVCLPEACDSSALDYQQNAENLDRLIKFNLMKPFNSDHYYVSDLYCPPDDRSPLRGLPLLGKLLIVGSLGWMALIGLATLVHLNVERFYTKAVRQIRLKQSLAREPDTAGQLARRASSAQKVNQSNNEYHESDILHLKHHWIRLNVYIWDQAQRILPGVDLIGCLSLYSNWLKYTERLKLAVARLHAEQERRKRIQGRQQQLVDAARANLAGKRSGNKSFSADKDFDAELDRRLEIQDDLDELDAEEVKRRVDTSSLNALKVIALFWIIAGHCVFYLGDTIGGSAILKNYTRDLAAYALANGAMYIVELFFIVTGCLTAYLAFKCNTYTRHAGGQSADARQLESRQSSHMESRMFSPPFWLMIIVNRYLRIVPTYLLVYSFVRLVSLYLGGSGQLWDYAVSGNSMRRQCANESWLPVLTLTTNFVDIYGHCIVGGWYLSTDMQFMVAAVPMLLVLAYCQRRRPGAQQTGGTFVAFGKQSGEQSQQQQHQQLTFVGASAGKESPVEDESLVGAGHLDKNRIVVSKRLLFGYLFVICVGLASAGISIVYGITQTEVDLSYILRFVPHTVAMLSRNIAMYTNSVFRFRAFALGLIVGHLLYLYEFQLIRLPKLVQQHGAKLTAIIFTIGFSIMFLPVLYAKGKIIVSHDLTAVLMVLSAGGIDLFICAMIFLVCIGKAPKCVLFLLNSPFWSVLSSLSLSAFLVHTEVIVVLTSWLNPPPAAHYCLVIFVFSSALIATYVLALGIYLSFEMPVSRLIEALMRKYFAKSSLARSDNPMVVDNNQTVNTQPGCEPTTTPANNNEA